MHQLKKAEELIAEKKANPDPAFTAKVSSDAADQLEKLAKGAERLIEDAFNPENFKERLEKFKAGV